MDFKPNYPIYLQVADFICDKVVSDEWSNGEKVPSLKELSVMVSVNPNTVVKSLAYLQEKNILESRRGIGYFLASNAKTKIVETKKQQFVEERLPEIFDTMKLLDISMPELETLYQQHNTDSN